MAHKAPFSWFEIWCRFIPAYNLSLMVLKTEKQLHLVATNPGWQSTSYLCSSIVARFIPLLNILSLQIVTLYKLRCNEKSCSRLCWNLCFWKNSLYWIWIWQDSQRWFKGPTPVGPMSRKNLFSDEIFSHFLILNPTDSWYVNFRTDDCYSC